MDYEPPYQITPDILQLAVSISEKVGRLRPAKNWDARPGLRRSAMIRSIHSSLAIEANSLSLSQVKDVIDGHTVLGPARDIQEVKKCVRRL